MQKAIKTTAKVSFLPFLILYEINQYIIYSKQLAENIKSIQRASIRDLRTKKFKFQAKPAPAQLLLVESSNKAYKKKRKDYYSYDQNYQD